VKRKPQKRADYLLRYRRDFPIAVVEAKTVYNNPGDGLQQAKEYAQILGLKFAYATNGYGFVEHDFLTGRDNDLQDFPSPEDLWSRLRASEGLTQRPPSECSRLTTIYPGSLPGIIKRLPSTAPCKASCKTSGECS
jgi:type I restriction enzyme R subunit